MRLAPGTRVGTYARLLAALEAQVGDSYLLAVTADHGMPSQPRSSDGRHFAPDIVDLLHQRFDPQAKALITSYEPENCQVFVDEDRLAELGLTLRDLAVFLESQPYVFAAFTSADALRAGTLRLTDTESPRPRVQLGERQEKAE
jgi:hypothetical protein